MGVRIATRCRCHFTRCTHLLPQGHASFRTHLNVAFASPKVAFVDGSPAPFEIVLGEAPARLSVSAEMDGNTSVHADGGGCSKDCIGVGIAGVVPIKHLA